jgi:hypothetical protein
MAGALPQAGGVIVLDFDFSALRRSDLIVGGGAIALFVFLFFFKWYGVGVTSSVGVSIGHSVNGWHAFTTSRWVWLITIVVALGTVLQRARRREPSLPVQLGAIVAGLGALSTVLIFYRIVHHPSGSGSEGVGLEHFTFSYGIKIGIWLALLAAAAITYGGYLAMQAEGTSLADVRDRASQAVSRATASVWSSTEGSASAPAVPPIPPTAAPGPGPPVSNGDE